MDGIIRNSTDSESPTHLQKVLEMCIGIFIWLAREWIGLHHADQCRLEFKVFVSHRCGWSGRNIGVGGGGKLVDHSLGHYIGANEVLPTGSTVFVS
jgi:hypothetical protein